MKIFEIIIKNCQEILTAVIDKEMWEAVQYEFKKRRVFAELMVYIH